jgi:hypothetical protein
LDGDEIGAQAAEVIKLPVLPVSEKVVFQRRKRDREVYNRQRSMNKVFFVNTWCL